MTSKRSLSLDEELARIDREIVKLEAEAAPWRVKLAPIQDALHELRKIRQAKEAASARGRSKRQPKHDYESAFRAYDEWQGNGALTQTARLHRIPIRTFSSTLDKRKSEQNQRHDSQ